MSVLPEEARPGPAVTAFHRRLPGYAVTPLRDLPELAAATGVGRVLVKDESSRMGLPAFKILGASWATYRVLCERLGGEPAWETLDDLAAVVAERLGPLRLVTATDGNHGRAVARMARLLGLDALILVPEGTAEARIEGIASEGAAVDVVPGTYDDAVRVAAELAGERDVVVSDTSWPGYEDPPRWVAEGYATIFAEVEDQAPAPPDVVVVPLGVGALGAAAGACLRAGLSPAEGPLLVGVEPESAACVAAAVEAGHVVAVPGPHRSIMAGLNCGLACAGAADPDRDLRRSSPSTTTAAGPPCGPGVGRPRRRRDRGRRPGRPDAGRTPGRAAVPGRATVLLLVTEGVTDPAGFERIVGGRPGARLSPR